MNEMVKDKVTLGILAHVDAGKTTLAEALLFLCGKIKTQGRVDHKDSYLDNYELERKRGITIFLKQARFSFPKHDITLIDTPGHVDFASEAERTLSVLDYAILVVSGVDGVQSHTSTLWSLLKRYNIPVFVFVNKSDITGRSEEDLIKELSEKLDIGFVNFTHRNDEDLASTDENLMNSYLEEGTLPEEMIAEAIRNRRTFPVLFGSALKLTGIDALIENMDRYMKGSYSVSEDGEAFKARVYKITRDSFGTRLTHIKVLSGKLKVKSEIENEKVNQLRLYSGEKYDTAEFVVPGDICAVAGLEKTFAGQMIGEEGNSISPLLSPVMSYRMILPAGTDVHHTLKNLEAIVEELPEISLVYLEETGEIQAQIMGEVQIEILKVLIAERLGLSVEFGVGTIIYKETVMDVSEGVGHFEPLRHYAEVHLKIEPGEPGTGIEIATDVSEDLLDKNWQRLICTHIAERKHRGVLTGSVLTDVKITVVGGRAHPKHTEGGDFRQATYRAVRHGLMYNTSVLLEPWYEFALEVPAISLGKVMTDISKMSGTIRTHEIKGNTAFIYGRCPVATMHGYALQVIAFTKGEGKLSVCSGGYGPCHNAEEVILSRNYSPEADLRNTADSVFCAHGAGFVVPWNEVTNYMHIEPCVKLRGSNAFINKPIADVSYEKEEAVSYESGYSYSASAALDKELAGIFSRTYSGSSFDDRGSRFQNNAPRVISGKTPKHSPLEKDFVEIKEKEKLEEYLLVDGYNIIFSWDELNDLSKSDLGASRLKLMEILSNYQGFRKMHLILVFDAYKVEGAVEKIEEYHNIHVVYTKEAETADRYIERTTKSLAKRYHVTVATSDATEQIIIWGAGALRMSARELYEAVNNTGNEITEIIAPKENKQGETLIDSLPKEMADMLNKKRYNN